MTQNSYTDDERRQVRRLRANPNSIGHGAAALDPRVMNGRNAAARHDSDDTLAYGPSEEEERKRKEQDGYKDDAIRHVVMNAIESATHSGDSTRPSWEQYDWSKKLAPRDQAIIYDRQNGSAMYADDGLTCGRIPDTTSSVAKAAEKARNVGTPILDQDAAYTRRDFASVAAGAHVNPLAAIETHRPQNAPHHISTTVGMDFTDPKQKSFSELSGLNGAAIEPLDIARKPTQKPLALNLDL